MPEEKPLKLVEKWDYLVRDGCKPIPVPLVRKICLDLASGAQSHVFYCTSCKVLHEHKQCPECRDSTIESDARVNEKIKLQEWPKY